MPLLTLETNLVLEDITKAKLASDASRLVAEQLGKPERYVMVRVQDRQVMQFAGDDAPTAYVELKSINLPEDGTKDLSAAICAFIERETTIPGERIYIEFANAPRHLWGMNGTTFEK